MDRMIVIAVYSSDDMRKKLVIARETYMTIMDTPRTIFIMQGNTRGCTINMKTTMLLGWQIRANRIFEAISEYKLTVPVTIKNIVKDRVRLADISYFLPDGITNEELGPATKVYTIGATQEDINALKSASLNVEEVQLIPESY